MIKFEHTETYGWEAAIRGMRNPMNSWDKSDSDFYTNFGTPIVKIGENDYDLMKRLRKGGSDDRKYLRQICVSVDITAPLYWWKEFDTYKVGTVANSCSTMHKIAAKEFTLDDFSYEHLFSPNEDERFGSKECLEYVLQFLNYYRKTFVETKDKKYWWQLIQLLPTSYNQRRTVTLNYEVLINMYQARKAHKLDEWREGFCGWVKTLPYNELITGEF